MNRIWCILCAKLHENDNNRNPNLNPNPKFTQIYTKDTPILPISTPMNHIIKSTVQLHEIIQDMKNGTIAEYSLQYHTGARLDSSLVYRPKGQVKAVL